eukprot:scaffold127320_cov20-Tisochrysis_lutea.AAC.1
MQVYPHLAHLHHRRLTAVDPTALAAPAAVAASLSACHRFCGPCLEQPWSLHGQWAKRKRNVHEPMCALPACRQCCAPYLGQPRSLWAVGSDTHFTCNGEETIKSMQQIQRTDAAVRMCTLSTRRGLFYARGIFPPKPYACPESKQPVLSLPPAFRARQAWAKAGVK